MRRPRARAAVIGALVLGALGAGCDNTLLPRIDSVVPGRVTNLARTPARIEGRDLVNDIAVNLDDESAEIERTWTVSIGSATLPQADVHHIDPTRIDVVIPAGLAVGLHDVTLVSPAGRAISKPEALEVTAEPIGLSISIEDAPGGGGAPIGDAGLLAGDRLPLYAIARSGGGAFAVDVAVTWAVAGGIGDFVGATDPAASVVFEARFAGTGTIAATHPAAAGDSTGLVSVAAGPPVRVAIDTSPGGVGLEIGDLPGLTTDDAIAMYAVSRDGFDNFVADEPVVWAVAGGIGAIGAGPTTTATFDPTTPGTGTVGASHPVLPGDQTGALTVAPGRVASFAVTPDSLALTVADPAVAFSTIGAVDADGNATTDLGTITWSVASGSIGSLDPATGVLTPTDLGAGSVRATSSHGPSDDSGPVSVSAVAVPELRIVTVAVPPDVVRSQRAIAVDVTVENVSAQPAPITGYWLAFGVGAVDLTADYAVEKDSRNAHEVATGESVVLRLWVEVAATAVTGSVNVITSLQGWLRTTSTRTAHTLPASWLVGTQPPPTAVVTGPIAPANRICQGQTVDFAAAPAAASFAWEITDGARLPAGSPAASASQSFTATFGALGAFSYDVAVTDASGVRNGARPYRSPVLVGLAAAAPQDRFPTGEVVITAPAASLDIQTIPLGSYSAGTVIDTGDLLQCDGAAMPTSSQQKYLTIWTDWGGLHYRGEDDVKPAIPGYQVWGFDGPTSQLPETLDNLDLERTSPELEGEAIVYVEYRKQPEDVVTAVGWHRFQVANDRQAPAVVYAVPAACGNGPSCHGIGQRWILGLSEPIDPSTANTVAVESKAGPGSCTEAGFAPLAAARSWDPISRTLSIVPADPGIGDHRVRVTVSSGVTDASSNANPATPFTRCALVSALAPPAAPATPTASAAPDPFSPDQDLAGDTTTFTAIADASAVLVRIRIFRGTTDVITLAAPVPGAGPIAVAWDGRDRAGRVVPDGYYAWDATAENAAGIASAPARGVIRVDSAPVFLTLPHRY